MDTFKYALAVIIGGGITFIGNYLLENRKLKNERFKYHLDKMISIGEEYYKLSTYSLIYFTSIVDTIYKREDYMSEGAQSYLNMVDSEYQKQLEQIKENNIVITTASMYFNITDSDKAITQMLLIKEATLKMLHGISNHDMDLHDQGRDEYISVIKSMINQIKTDQLTISKKIKSILKETIPQ